MNVKVIKPTEYLNVHHIPSSNPKARYHFIWAHGWMRTHADYLSIANQLSKLGEHSLIDLPGHADTSKDCGDWSIEQYVDHILDWVRTIDTPIIWVGHSFGCRIGAHIAKHLSKKIKVLFLICPPFNKSKKFKPINGWLFLKKWTYRLMINLGAPKNKILPYFASKDYIDAEDLRPLFVKWVNEDSGDALKDLKLPIKLIFAKNDTETPEHLSNFFAKYCKHAQIVKLDFFDHHSILTDGQHQIIHQLITTLREIES